MVYEFIKCGVFLSRPNRFLAKVVVDGKEETVHVKNTGRCKELLQPGVFVYLEDFFCRMGKRKFRYSLVAVEKRYSDGSSKLINIDSQAPNAVIKESFASSNLVFKSEVVYKDSRFDFYFEKDGKKGFLEVKGVTLENDGHCLFPDAPTQRGVKHLTELIDASKNGYVACVLFLIQLENALDFSPNREMHSAFADKLVEARDCGVNILCYDCNVVPNGLTLANSVKVVL